MIAGGASLPEISVRLVAVRRGSPEITVVGVSLLATVLYCFVTQDRGISLWEGPTLPVSYAVFVLGPVP